MAGEDVFDGPSGGDQLPAVADGGAADLDNANAADDLSADEKQAAEETAAVEAAMKAVSKTTDEERKPDQTTDIARSDVGKPAADKTTDDLYRIPHGASGEYRKQYKALSDHARSIDTELAQMRESAKASAERIGAWESTLKDAGANAQVLAGHLGYIKAVNSGNLEQALAWIENERTALARALGQPLDGVDVLGDFPDLRRQVDEMEMSENAALELARHRRAAQAHQHAANAQHQDAQRHAVEQQAAQVRANGLESVRAWLSEVEKNDINYAAKEPIVAAWLEKPETIASLRAVPPEQWIFVVRSLYDSIQSAPERRDPGTLRPLRPGGPGGRGMSKDADPTDVAMRAAGYF